MIYHDFSKEIDERSIELGLKNNDVWPILDGPFNESIYSQQSTKILFVLKEAFDDFNVGKPYGGGWKLGKDWKNTLKYEEIKHSKTFTNLAYLTYGLYENKETKDMPWIYEDADVPSSLLKTGIINTGKMPAYSSTAYSHLNKIASDWIDIDIKQLEEYNPDIIVFGGTFYLYADSFGLSDYYHEVNEDGVYGFAIKDNKLYINAYHPNVRSVSPWVYIDRILSVARAYLKNRT